MAPRQRDRVLAARPDGRLRLLKDPALAEFAGRVSDSGEGRWTIKAAIDEAVPVPVLSAALYDRFSSRGEADFQQAAVGDALRVRRSPGKTKSQLTTGRARWGSPSVGSTPSVLWSGVQACARATAH